MKKEKIFKYLNFYNQDQLLNFFDELNFFQKNKLVKQIKNTNLKLMNNLYKNSFFDEEMDVNKISNLKCIDNISESEKNKYIEIGKKLVKDGKYGIVIMAGGNASRLGINTPKGCLELDLNNKKISLFEIYISKLIEIYKEYNVYIKLYIMTSNYNYRKTIEYFKENNYFNYPKKNIKFFIQSDLPILDKEGKILLKEKYSILYGPNGNGDVFKSLKKYHLIDDMKKNNIKFALFSTVDNVLTNLVDFCFIGATIYNNYEVASKTLFKENENDKNWVFCKYGGKPYMIQSNYINSDISNKKDNDGKYMYRDTNITYHLISINEIEKYSKIELKYHRAYKKNNYIDLKGNYIKPTDPNSFKFEKFIFDAFYYSDDMLLYRISKDQFCPIKSESDIKKAETALKENLKF